MESRIPKSFFELVLLLLSLVVIHPKSFSQVENISFYSVPLVCGAAPEIGCGSRIKPLFIDTGKEKEIRESWTNRQGTIIAIVWNDQENEEQTQSLFSKNEIAAERIHDPSTLKKTLAHFREEGKWLQGMEVDQLSLEEAGVLANELTQFAKKAKLINREEQERIRKDFEEYYKKELVIVRTYDELTSLSTQERWMQDGYLIYVKHIGEQRANEVSDYYHHRQDGKVQEESCCQKGKKQGACCNKEKQTSLQSDITCPECGHKKTETMPTDACLIRYTCEQCQTVLTPLDGDCCVFCSYGTHKCPSIQEK